MTGPKGNSEFCFPETLEVEGKQNSLFPEGPVVKCFVIPPDSKIEMIGSFEAFATRTGRAVVKTELLYRHDTIIVFFFAVNKK